EHGGTDDVVNDRVRFVPFEQGAPLLHDLMDLFRAQWLERPAPVVLARQRKFFGMQFHLSGRHPRISSMIRPSCMCTARGQLAATPGSWVTTSRVDPRRA